MQKRRKNSLGVRALKAIGKRMRKGRKGADMTQVEMAKVLQVDASNVRHYESGRQAPSAAVLVRYCKHMNVSADEILGL